jgi:hypothetical protein
VAIAASVAMVSHPQRRIATVDCAVMNRFTNAMSRLKCLSAFASTKILEGLTREQISVVLPNKPTFAYAKAFKRRRIAEQVLALYGV